jgi:predicted TIM-barrel fold metal-dependent hydrolase
VEVHGEGRLLIDALSLLRTARVRALVDHRGRPDAAAGVSQPAFQDLLRLGRDGDIVMKLSAAYRVSAMPPPCQDLDPYAEALLKTFTPRRCVWGSDWPFINTRRRPDYGTVRNAIDRWVSGDDLNEVLWSTPARLCGFTTSQPQGDSP